MSNFELAELDCLLGSQSEPPLLNQIGFSLGTTGFSHAALLDAHTARGVALQANRPLAGGGERFSSQMRESCAAIGAPRGKAALPSASLAPFSSP